MTDALSPRPEAPTNRHGPLDLAASLFRWKAAVDELSRVCKEIWNGERGWRWSIPVDVNRDTDAILGGSLCDIPLLIAEVERLRAEKDRLTSEPAIHILPSDLKRYDGAPMMLVAGPRPWESLLTGEKSIPLYRASEPTNEEKP